MELRRMAPLFPRPTSLVEVLTVNNAVMHALLLLLVATILLVMTVALTVAIVVVTETVKMIAATGAVVTMMIAVTDAVMMVVVIATAMLMEVAVAQTVHLHHMLTLIVKSARSMDTLLVFAGGDTLMIRRMMGRRVHILHPMDMELIPTGIPT
jgi:hypothetical protein